MIFRNAAHAFVVKLDEALSQGAEVEVRGARTRELLHQHVVLERPLERTISLPHRHNDLFAAIAETVWVIAGRNDMDFLQHYLPRAPEFSDDGAVWRAGYGPRLRNWGGVDQLTSAVQLLRSSPDSRRAVISLFDPAVDYTPSLDVPCTNWLHFVVRDGRLDLSVAVRSNDLVWGFSGINTFEWSVLHEMVATWLDVEPGLVHYFISSLHVYERHWERGRRIVAETLPWNVIPTRPADTAFTTPLADLDSRLAEWFTVEQGIRDGLDERSRIQTFPDKLLRDFLWALLARRCADRADTESLEQALASIQDPNLANALRAQLDPSARVPVVGAPSEVLRRQLSRRHEQEAAAWHAEGAVAIFASMAGARDRLESWASGDVPAPELIAETVLDLAIDAMRYSCWLRDRIRSHAVTENSARRASFEDVARMVDLVQAPGGEAKAIPELLEDALEALTALERSFEVGGYVGSDTQMVDQLVRSSYSLADAVTTSLPLAPGGLPAAYGASLNDPASSGLRR